MAFVMTRRDAMKTIGFGGVALLTHATAPTAATAAGLTLAEVKASGKLRIGVEAAYVPFTFRHEGKIIGYDVDLAGVICEDLGVKPEIIDTAWTGVIPSLYAKKFDMIMTSLSYTADRMQKVGYSIPYAEASMAMLIRAGDAGVLKSPDDLVNKVIATKLGTPSEILAKKLNDQLKASKGAGFGEVKVFNDDPPRYLALAQGKVDAVFNTVPTLAVVMKDQPGKFALVRGLGADNWAGLAVRKEDTELVDFLNAEIRKLKANEVIYKLQEKWFGFRMNLPDKLPSL
jgi:polar amino acid transport system substrate-binding protein